MIERLKLLRKELHMKQGEFAKRISTTQGHISDIENGRKELSGRTIKLICLEFNVNETWLKTGEGEMFNANTQDEELAYLIGKILAGKNDFVKNAMLTLAKLDEEDWTFIEHLIKKLKDGTK